MPPQLLPYTAVSVRLYSLRQILPYASDYTWRYIIFPKSAA